MNKTWNYNAGFLLSLLFFIIGGCNTTPRNIPFPQQESEFSNPTTEKLTFSEPSRLDWVTINLDSVEPVTTERFDLNKIPSKKFDINNSIPVTRKIKDSKFYWKNIPDSAFNLDNLPFVKLKFKTAMLGQPKRVKAGMPRLKDGASESLLMFGQDQGLPGTIGSCFLQDKNGIMWIGTDNGLCRFDGEYCEIYTLTQGLSKTWITKLLEDSYGQIWVSYLGGGLSVLNTKTGIIKHLSADDGSIMGWGVNSFLEDIKGMIWIATELGINIIDEKGETIRHLNTAQGLRNTSIPDLLKDNNGKIWIVAQENGIDVIDSKEGRIKHIGSAQGLGNVSVSRLNIDAEGQIWIGTYKDGVKVLNEISGNIKQVISFEELGNNPILDIAFDIEGNIWLATQKNGVIFYDTKNETIKHLTTTQGLGNDNVISDYSDKQGQVWIGTFGGDINIYNTNSGNIRHLNSARGLGNRGDLIYGFMEDSHSRFWVGSAGGIDVIDEKNGTLKNISTKQGLSKNEVSYLFMDSRGRVWVCSSNNVDEIDEEAGTIKHWGSSPLLNFYTVGCLAEDSQGQIWIGKGGVYVINEKKGILKQAQGISNDWIECILHDRKGQVWISSGSGVDLIDEKAGTIKKITGKGLDGIQVLNLIEDSLGRIWIASSGNGLFMIDQNRTTLTNFSVSSGLAEMAVFIINERKGSIYAGTGRGVTVITPGNEKNTWQIKSYGKSQGFLRVDHNPRSLLSKDGRLWWGITDVVTIMGEPKYDSLIPQSLISALDINGQPQSFITNKSIQLKLQGRDTIWSTRMDTFYTKNNFPADTGYLQKNNISLDSTSGAGNMPVNLHLPYHQNHLTFYFTGVHLDNLNKTRYRYVLEGNDDTWSQITGNAYADYRNLSSGDYTFRVSSRGFNGLWSIPAELSFTISPPWWLTTWAYLLYGLIFLISLSSFIRWRLSSLKKEKKVLEEKVALRTTQLKAEKEKAENTLEELKSTQSQLIQREKMASLGELTAGIAHEIQNPLNFVNNFSEVNKELLVEMKTEMDKGNLEDAKALANDVMDNEEKINNHGRRADAIVKGMLQHSRTSSGVKEPTDINALADEYLRLAYHGLRAKDKSFNAAMKTDLDETIGKINIVPQEIGRVILNLITNAFYTVTEKKKSQPENYEPTLTVTTKKIGDKILIGVKDNGNGIPQKILDKIFQPFFTTKPTGQGSGLGLSLAYDIVKAHGGALKVETKEGEGSEFIIQLVVV